MKKTSLILSAFALVVAAFGFQSCNNAGAGAPAASETSTAAATKGAIVYFNLDKVLSEYDMANELRSAVESKVANINQEVTRRGNKLQSDVNAFQDKINKGLITRSVAEVQSQKLSDQQAEFQNYALQKEQEINEEQAVMMNQLADAINTYIQKLNEEKQYALVLTTQGDILSAPVVAGDASLDITDAVIAGLNEEYVKTKASQNK
ncbi:MAG: OmpH family outer membrane protein [Bacteroidales bacterium]|nr:OmpH family outer membrane protein [Bacteroidales bacterium]